MGSTDIGPPFQMLDNNVTSIYTCEEVDGILILTILCFRLCFFRLYQGFPFKGLLRNKRSKRIKTANLCSRFDCFSKVCVWRHLLTSSIIVPIRPRKSKKNLHFPDSGADWVNAEWIRPQCDGVSIEKKQSLLGKNVVCNQIGKMVIKNIT